MGHSSAVPSAWLLVAAAIGLTACADLPAPVAASAAEAKRRNVEPSVAFVGAYLRKAGDPLSRVRAIYDYVGDRVAFDYDARDDPSVPDEAAAERVFAARRGSSTEIAKLVARLALFAEVSMKVVSGTSRAWNIACIEGRPLYVDVSRATREYYSAGWKRRGRYPRGYVTFDVDVFAVEHSRTFELGPSPPSSANTSCRWARALGADARWSKDCAPRWLAKDC